MGAVGSEGLSKCVATHKNITDGGQPSTMLGCIRCAIMGVFICRKLAFKLTYIIKLTRRIDSDP